jgi:hypothetical protein
MPVVLWLLGLVTTVGGLLLVASGVGVRDGTFDSEVLTPGMVGVVGGLLLIGLGIAVRELRRIERALAARPLPRADRPAEAIAAQAAEAPALVPAPLAVKVEPKTEADVAGAATPIAEDEALERLRAKFPTFARRQNGPIVQGDTSPVLPGPVRLEVEEAIAAEVRGAAATTVRAANGGARAVRLAPRPAAKPHPTSVSPPARTNGAKLNTFWPTGPRRDDQQAASLQTALAAQSPLPVTTAVSETSAVNETAPGGELAGSDAQSGPAASVTVLKSGVVEGMAYALYSDGSIEAQLPQGTLRFGSIGALRDHIEGAAP